MDSNVAKTKIITTFVSTSKTQRTTYSEGSAPMKHWLNKGLTLSNQRVPLCSYWISSPKNSHPKGQGKDKADGNPVYLLRHPHGKRGATGGQDRTKGAFGGCLTLKLAVNAGVHEGELYPRHEKRTKNPAETTGKDIKLKFWWVGRRNWRDWPLLRSYWKH